jgi:hypothetical protein
MLIGLDESLIPAYDYLTDSTQGHFYRALYGQARLSHTKACNIMGGAHNFTQIPAPFPFQCPIQISSPTSSKERRS